MIGMIGPSLGFQVESWETVHPTPPIPSFPEAKASLKPAQGDHPGWLKVVPMGQNPSKNLPSIYRIYRSFGHFSTESGSLHKSARPMPPTLHQMLSLMLSWTWYSARASGSRCRPSKVDKMSHQVTVWAVKYLRLRHLKLSRWCAGKMWQASTGNDWQLTHVKYSLPMSVVRGANQQQPHPSDGPEPSSQDIPFSHVSNSAYTPIWFACS